MRARAAQCIDTMLRCTELNKECGYVNLIMVLLWC